MRSRRIFLASTVAISLLAAGCIKQYAKSMAELQTLHAALTKKFGEEPSVHINDAGSRLTLSISFVNSALNDKSPEDRAQRAQDTANLVKTIYPRAQQLAAIWVFFVRQKTSMLVFHYTQTVDYFGFDKAAARLTSGNGIGSGDSVISNNGVELKTTVTYIDSSHETDVSASGIQLAGNPGGNGLTVLPHYRVNGDVNTGQQRPPREVSFDFASYADKSEFQQTTPVAFIADGKEVLRKEGTFTGTNTQFCYLTVPYSAFRKLIDARQLTIKLGDKAYRLNRAQFALLQQMGAYVAD
jgi:hypothetical protein